jgi:hypothetical protein
MVVGHVLMCNLVEMTTASHGSVEKLETEEEKEE